MQLLPATAERFGVATGIAPEHAQSATADAGESVALGAWYLSLLADRFGGLAPGLAAYNAGPAATALWSEREAGLPLDEWVENISFRETRRYVKAVLADATVYRWLRGGGTLAIDGLRPVPAPRDGIAF